MVWLWASQRLLWLCTPLELFALDLKPTNVLITPWTQGGRLIAHAADGTALTQTGVVVGSPSWMAPELAQGRETTPAVDVVAWGATVAFASTGQFRLVRGLLMQ